MTRLEEVRQYWQQRWHIHYASVNGVWHLLRQRRVKYKTGRRRDRRAEVFAPAAFKKLWTFTETGWCEPRSGLR